MPPPITLKSPLPADDLLFESMTSSAGLSTLGETQLSLLSPKPDLKPEDLLGKPVTVTVQLRDDAKRHFNGFVSRFGIGAHRGRYFAYQATVQSVAVVPDAHVRLPHLPGADASPTSSRRCSRTTASPSSSSRLFRTYRKWVYCVQYRESDFNFVARLLEHEGIYWYFEHGDGQHKLVLVDSQSAHDAAPRASRCPTSSTAPTAAPDTDCVSRLALLARGAQRARSALTSYDFERPSTDLKVDAAKQRSYTLSDYEVFDFQGDYIQASRRHAVGRGPHGRAADAASRRCTAASNAQGIEVGRLLKLAKHPRADQNAQYLITSLRSARTSTPTSPATRRRDFRCDFSAIPATQQFRPPRRTPKPFVQGPQTAVVVGPAGEEIFTDKYGRVKVQFHWDRYGKKDEKSSCWVRVSQPWAGKNLGRDPRSRASARR